MSKIRLKYIHEYRDSTGKVRRYVRRRGLPKVTLPGLPGSPEFMEAYSAAIAGAPVPRGRGYKAGSLGAVVERYYRSVEFANLKPKSQAAYRLALSPHVEKDGHRMAADLPAEKARKIVEEIGAEKPGMANLTRAVLAAVFEFAIDCGLRKDNPFKRVPVYRLGTRHTWTDEQLAAYEQRWPLGTRERLAYAVLLYSAQRVSDAVKLKRAATITLTQDKTGEELTIPVHPALARALKAVPANSIYMIARKSGRPINGGSLTRLIRDAVRKAGLPPMCTAHGLRKAALRRLAENSATTKGIAAVSGHRTLKEVERYTAKANQTRLAAAAMALIPDEDNG
jgi:integrase